MDSSSQQHMDLLLSLINVKLFNSLDGQRLGGTDVFLFDFHSFYLCSFSLASIFMPILFSKHLCVLASLSLPSHSWRSDGHGESVGQQPWNKYGWSWVRWARIICFAICLCESVDVMTVFLSCPVSPPKPGRHLTEMHAYWAHKVTHKHKHHECTVQVCNHPCMRAEMHKEPPLVLDSQFFPLKGIAQTSAYISPSGSKRKPPLPHVIRCLARSVSIWPTVAIRNDRLTIGRQDWCWWLFSWQFTAMWQSVRVPAWETTWDLCSLHYGHLGK